MCDGLANLRYTSSIATNAMRYKECKMTFTVDQIARAAELSMFYVRPDGVWLRILFVEPSEGYLQGLDEDRGDEYAVTFEEIAAELDPHFEQLQRVSIANI